MQALLPRIMPTLLGALLNLFALVYFFQRGENYVWLAGAHAVMVVVLAIIVSNKIKAFKAEEAARRRSR
jgi:hypothetical protein